MKIIFGNATLTISTFILKPGAGTEGEGAEFPLDLPLADVFIRRNCFQITEFLSPNDKAESVPVRR